MPSFFLRSLVLPPLLVGLIWQCQLKLIVKFVILSELVNINLYILYIIFDGGYVTLVTSSPHQKPCTYFSWSQFPLGMSCPSRLAYVSGVVFILGGAPIGRIFVSRDTGSPSYQTAICATTPVRAQHQSTPSDPKQVVGPKRNEMQ